MDNGLLVQPQGKSAKSKSKSKAPDNEATTIRLCDVRCKSRLGGLLKHYYRKAA